LVVSDWCVDVLLVSWFVLSASCTASSSWFNDGVVFPIAAPENVFIPVFGVFVKSEASPDVFISMWEDCRDSSNGRESRPTRSTIGRAVRDAAQLQESKQRNAPRRSTKYLQVQQTGKQAGTLSARETGVFGFLGGLLVLVVVLDWWLAERFLI
jgi:hypothetical protein